MATAVYTPIDDTNGEIRLLAVEPAVASDDPLICFLLPALLSHPPPFEALSYTWGLPGLISQIQLNGQPFPIQENATAALRRLRRHDTTRILWIDAICINQANAHEKEHQLLLMRSIYEQAEQVCVWLGEPTESTELAIQDLQNPVGIGLTTTIEESVFNYYMATLIAPSHPFCNITSGTAWNWSDLLELELGIGDFRELMSRPWWGRVWVIQEAVVTRKLLFMVGGETFLWENIERSLERIRKGRVLQWTGTLEIFGIVANPELFSAQDETYQLISRLRKAWHSDSFEISVYELLYDFRFLRCTDERDRVFGCLGLLAKVQSLDIAPDYTTSTRDVYVKTALSIIHNSGTLDILNCAREWRDVKQSVTPDHAFSLPDQAKYHDVGAMVNDGPGTTSRRGWARLPPGWERIPPKDKPKLGALSMFRTMWKGNSARYYDHNTGTIHEKSPLEGKEPQLCRHPVLQRELPPGWTKTWDNFGRAAVRYDPNSSQPPGATQPTQSGDNLNTLPSWAPNLAAITHFDPKPLLDWSETHPRYNACASTSATAIPNALSTLTVEGALFDTILAISTPWHPTGPIVTRRSAPILETWEALALDTSIFAPHPCSYASLPGGRKEALWRTHIADYTNQLTADAETTKPLIEAWCDRSGWGTPLPTLEESASQNIWQASSTQIDTKYQHWDLYSELRRAEGYDFNTKGVDERYAEVIKRIYDVCAHRALFVTRRGYIGLGPWNAEVGDEVCVLKGGKTPFLLRKERGEGYYRLVGEVFVQGIMGGEGMLGEGRVFCLV